jgi:hypothetical protein
MLKSGSNKDDKYLNDREDMPLPELLPHEMLISQQIESARRDRRRWEGEWQSNEASLFDIGSEGGALRSDNQVSQMGSTGEEGDIGSAGDPTDNFMGINISARNMQLIFSQLVSNAPVVMGIPNSNEQEDINAAKGSEGTTSYMRKQYKIDNAISLAAYNTFTYGIGFVKQIYDGTKGVLVSVQGKTGATGDHVFTVPSPWDVYMDPNAKRQEELTWLTQRVYVSFPEAVEFFGEDKAQILTAFRVDNTSAPIQGYTGNASLLYDVRFDSVEIFERWEIGTTQYPKGRLIYHLRDGRILKEGPNPCSHPIYRESGSKSAQLARLPYSIFTYEDIPNTVWGRTPAAKAGRAQNVLNACYMIVLQTAQNMGVPHLVVNKSSLGENPDAVMTNNAINIIPLDLAGESGGTMPFVLQAATASKDIGSLIEYSTNYINDAWGVNDALLGKQQRETQGITMQLSIMQGNMIRERLFNKFVYFVEDVYNLALDDACKHWTKAKFTLVLGKNNPTEVDALHNALIAGGYTLKIERSNIFALDPITRQEQILGLRQVFQEAGVDPRFMIKQLRLADLRSIYDEFDKADTRAQKIIEKLKGDEKVTLRKYEDHVGIFGFMQRYTMTEEYDQLEPEVQMRIEKHMDERLKAEGGSRLPASAPSAPPAGDMGGSAMPPPAAPQIGPM